MPLDGALLLPYHSVGVWILVSWVASTSLVGDFVRSVTMGIHCAIYFEILAEFFLLKVKAKKNVILDTIFSSVKSR